MAHDFETVRARYLEGIRLLQTYPQDPDPEVLDRAEAALRWVLVNGVDEARAAVSQNLATIALLRWDRDGRRRDLGEAVTLLRAALAGAYDPVNALNCVHDLARALREYGTDAELDESIALYRRLTASATVRPDPAAHLAEAADAHRHRHLRTGRRDDAIEAI